MTAAPNRTWRLVGTVLALCALLAAMLLPRLLVSPQVQLAKHADVTYEVGATTLRYTAEPGPSSSVLSTTTTTTLDGVAEAGTLTVLTQRQLERPTANPVTALTAKEGTFTEPTLQVTAPPGGSAEYVSDGLELAWPGNLDKKSYYVADPLIDDLLVVDFVEETDLDGLDVFIYTGRYADTPAAAPIRQALSTPELRVSRQWTLTLAPRSGHIVNLELETLLTDGTVAEAPILFEDEATLDEQTQAEQLAAAKSAARTISIWGTWVPLILTIAAGMLFLSAWRQPARSGRHRLAAAVAP